MRTTQHRDVIEKTIPHSHQSPKLFSLNSVTFFNIDWSHDQEEHNSHPVYYSSQPVELSGTAQAVHQGLHRAPTKGQSSGFKGKLPWAAGTFSNQARKDLAFPSTEIALQKASYCKSALGVLGPGLLASTRAPSKQVRHVILSFPLPSNFSTGQGGCQGLPNWALAPWEALSREISTICYAVLPFPEPNARISKDSFEKVGSSWVHNA